MFSLRALYAARSTPARANPRKVQIAGSPVRKMSSGDGERRDGVIITAPLLAFFVIYSSYELRAVRLTLEQLRDDMTYMKYRYRRA